MRSVRLSGRQQRASVETSRSRRGARGTTPPVIPPEAALRAEYNQLAGYRLLVTFLEYFTLEAAIKLRQLSAVEQEAIREVDRHRAHPTPPRRWEPDLDRPVQRQDASGLTVVVYPYEKQKRRRGGPWASTLALAWVLMGRDIQQATGDPKVGTEVSRLVHQWGCDPATLLRLSYVPREVAGLLHIRLEMSVERREDANASRRLRQLVARDLPIPPELAGLSPTDRRQERLWWKALGLDKESRTLSRQRLWGEIVVPLLNALGAMSVKISTRRVALDVSRLLRVRYPDLEIPDSEMIRKRWARADQAALTARRAESLTEPEPVAAAQARARQEAALETALGRVNEEGRRIGQRLSVTRLRHSTRRARPARARTPLSLVTEEATGAL